MTPFFLPFKIIVISHAMLGRKMIKEFHYKFEELQITEKDMAPLLGFSENIPEPFPQYIEQSFAKAPELCTIKGGYHFVSEIDTKPDNSTIIIAKKVFNPTKAVSTQLKKAQQLVLFVCTAGEGLSQHARAISNEDPMLAYVFDVLGSVVVEKAMDKIQEQLQKEVAQQGLGISDRYSPGHCEWSLTDQVNLFSFFPDNFCGIQLSDSLIMHPIKSISGIIGIGEGLKPRGFQCQLCKDQNCIYGKMRRQ